MFVVCVQLFQQKIKKEVNFMKEKVLYVELPDGAKYRMVKVTEGGKNGIVYTEEGSNNEEVTKANQTATEAPMPLIGGTDVYHKENGTNYWYCKIKNGRDEFMFLPFGDITERDLLYDAQGKKRVFSTDRQRKFKADALEAIKNKPTEGFRWIPVYEPSMGENGEIQFVPGKEVLVRLNSYEWEELLSNYSHENESQEASKTTYFLLLMRWLKDGVATLEQVVDHSEEIGHFWDSENAKHALEKTGEREFGGLCGFAGNTYKEVKNSKSRPCFSVIGGCYFNNGYRSPLAGVYHKDDPLDAYNNSVAFLELKK